MALITLYEKTQRTPSLTKFITNITIYKNSYKNIIQFFIAYKMLLERNNGQGSNKRRQTNF